MTTIKNVTEEKEKESSKAQLDFLAPIQLTTTTERGGGGEGKNNPKESIEQVKKVRIVNVFLESLLSESFPMLGITVYLASPGCPPTLY